MKYPIFNSVINKIQTELSFKDIKTSKFRVWNDSTINATGLETSINVSHEQTGIKELHINFDWDVYRELAIARQLNGMDRHPLLREDALTPLKGNPTIDVEISWHFDTDGIHNSLHAATHQDKLEFASLWMKSINEKLHQALPTEQLISRWHFDVTSGVHGKYVSAMCLITYFQYSLSGMNELNDIHDNISKIIQSILQRNTRVLRLISDSKPKVA